MVIVFRRREGLDARRTEVGGVVVEIEDSCSGLVDVKESERG